MRSSNESPLCGMRVEESEHERGGLPDIAPIENVATANWNGRIDLGTGYIAMALTRDKFTRFETNGVSCRRMSPPPWVVCCE